jgi:hypothetical protein
MQKDPVIAAQVKEILNIIKELSPGGLVELRIPPYAAIQCVAGGNHKRGTPPNTVEMSGQVLIKLINDPSIWHTLCSQGDIAASGINSDLSEIFILAGEKYKSI